MHYEQNCDGLKKLKLLGFLNDYASKHSDPAYLKQSIDEAFAGHICAQLQCNEQRQYKRLLRAALLKYPNACIEDIDYVAERGLVASVMASVNSLHWVDRCQNVFFIGATGTGKTYLSCALSHQCIRQGMSVIHYRLSQLLEHIELCRADGSLAKFRAKLQKAKVLALDDFGSIPITQKSSHDLLEVPCPHVRRTIRRTILSKMKKIMSHFA